MSIMFLPMFKCGVGGVLMGSLAGIFWGWGCRARAVSGVGCPGVGFFGVCCSFLWLPGGLRCMLGFYDQGA